MDKVEGKLKIVVFLTKDYKKSEVFYVDEELTKDEITNEVNKRFDIWWYYDIW